MGSSEGQESEDVPSDDRDSNSTRRQVLKLIGGLGGAAVLGAAGWTGRTIHLSSQRDRTHLGTPARTGIRVTGPNADVIPDELLISTLEQYSDEHSDVGLQATVVLDDDTTWSGVTGNADHDDNIPLSFDSHLYIGSVTKFYTATLVLRQIERGSLSLTDTIDDWFDLEYAENVTVRMLLNHTSGIPSYTEDAWFVTRYFGRPTKRWQPDELVNVIRGKPLKFDSGSEHEYSNTNYVLLGLLLEQETDTRYQDLLQTLVREELGYHRTYYRDYPDDTPIANGYDESIFGLGRRNLTGFRTSLETGAYAAGGILSAAPNVAEFVRSVFSGAVLSDDALAEMQTFTDAPDEDVPEQQGYGLGIRHLQIDGEDVFGHTGTIPGYSAIAMHHDDPQYTIAVLSNVSTIDQAAVYSSLQGVLLEDVY